MVSYLTNLLLLNDKFLVTCVVRKSFQSTLQNLLFINNSPYMDGPQKTFINAIREKLSQNNIDVADKKDLLCSDDDDDRKKSKKAVSTVACVSNNERNHKKAYIICSALEYLLSKQEGIVNRIEPMLLKIEEISPSLDNQLTNVIKKELKTAKKKYRNNYKSKNSKTCQKCDNDQNRIGDTGDTQDENIRYLYKSDYFSNKDSKLTISYPLFNEEPILWRNPSLRKSVPKDSGKYLSTRSLPLILNKLNTANINPIWRAYSKEKGVILIHIPGVMAFPNLYSTILSRSRMNLHTASPIENHLLCSKKNSGETRISKHMDEDHRETNSFRIRLKATRTIYNNATNDSQSRVNKTSNKHKSTEDSVKCVNQDHKEKDKEKFRDTISLKFPQNVFTDAEKDNLQRIFSELLQIEVKRKMKKQKLYSRSDNVLGFLLGMSKNYLRTKLIDKNNIKDKPDVVEYLYKNIKELTESGTNTEPITEPVVADNTTNTEPVIESGMSIESGTNTEPDEKSDIQVNTSDVSVASKNKQREKLFKINQEVFNDFENKLKYVKILKSSESNANLEQKLSVGDNIDVNILNVMKAHSKCNKEISKLRLDAQEEVLPSQEDVEKPKIVEINSGSNQTTDYMKTETQENTERIKQELPKESISIPDIISTPDVNMDEKELEDQPLINYIDHSLLMSKLMIKPEYEYDKESSESTSCAELKETLQAASLNSITKQVSFPNKTGVELQRQKENSPKTSNNSVQINQSMLELTEKPRQEKTTMTEQQNKSPSNLQLKDKHNYSVGTISYQANQKEFQELIPKAVKRQESLTNLGKQILKHESARKIQSQYNNINNKNVDSKISTSAQEAQHQKPNEKTNNGIRIKDKAFNLCKSFPEIRNVKAENNSDVQQTRSTPIGLKQNESKHTHQFSTQPNKNKINKDQSQVDSSGVVLNKCVADMALDKKAVQKSDCESHTAVNKQSLLKVFEDNKPENKGSDQKSQEKDEGTMTEINCKDQLSTCDLNNNDKLGLSSRDTSLNKSDNKQITTVLAYVKSKANKKTSRIPILQSMPKINHTANERKQHLKEVEIKNSMLNTNLDDPENTISEDMQNSVGIRFSNNSLKMAHCESVSNVQEHNNKQICNELVQNIVDNVISSVGSNQQGVQDEVTSTEEYEEYENETNKEEREPWGTNVCNIVPVHFKKPNFFSTIPNGTIWSQEPRNQNQITYYASDTKKFKKQKKYRYETKEVDSANGKKVRITYLVLDNN